MKDVIEETLRQEGIVASQRNFDLSTPLTPEEELMMAAAFDTSQTPEERSNVGDQAYALRSLDEDPFAETDLGAVVTTNKDYNVQYAHYLRCQAIAAIAEYEEGWSAIRELIINSYVKMRRIADENYRGDNPNKAFSLRLKRLITEDFARFIISQVEEAAKVPKPTLAAKTASDRIVG